LRYCITVIILRSISRQQLAALADFRFRLAQFLGFSERASRAAGITPKQYLLLLHVRGRVDRNWASIGELAERLQSSHHGTVALVNRCAASGLVRRRRHRADGRTVEVHLTAHGGRLVERVARRHHEELRSLRDLFQVAHVS
jgi:DNA-binding MarR family transcriptional regulator